MADGADGEDVRLRVVLDRPPALGGELRTGRIAAGSRGLRLLLDIDGDGLRQTADPCPTEASNDSLVVGVCDSVTLAQGWWCASGGGRQGAGFVGWGLALLSLAARRRRGGPSGDAPAAERASSSPTSAWSRAPAVTPRG